MASWFLLSCKHIQEHNIHSSRDLVDAVPHTLTRCAATAKVSLYVAYGRRWALDTDAVGVVWIEWGRVRVGPIDKGKAQTSVR